MGTVNGNQHSDITEDYCSDWVAETKDGTNFLEKGGLGAVEQAFENGVVLVMSMWDDHYANMLWLDSTYPVDSSDPGAARGPCPTTSGDPKDVESSQANAKVTFSDIRFADAIAAIPEPKWLPWWVFECMHRPVPSRHFCTVCSELQQPLSSCGTRVISLLMCKEFTLF